MPASRDQIDRSTSSRRIQGASSARSLLLTVLGEFVLPGQGAVWTSTLLDAMSLLGVEAKTTRQALARSASADLIAPVRLGRQTFWSLTPSARRLLTEGTARIYEFGLASEPWDGSWLVIFVSVPETDRHLRHRLRTRLAWHGFAAIAPGTWLSPRVASEGDALDTLNELGLASEAVSFIGKPGALGDIEGQAHLVWEVATVEAHYQSFIHGTKEEAPVTESDCFVALISLIHEWRQFPAADPGLPDVLLPEPWSRSTAASLFHDRHECWRSGAWRWWNDHAPPLPAG